MTSSASASLTSRGIGLDLVGRELKFGSPRPSRILGGGGLKAAPCFLYAFAPLLCALSLAIAFTHCQVAQQFTCLLSSDCASDARPGMRRKTGGRRHSLVGPCSGRFSLRECGCGGPAGTRRTRLTRFRVQTVSPFTLI